MSAFILPLADPAATAPDRVGPKAANWRRLCARACRRRAGFASRPMPIGGKSNISDSPMRSPPIANADQPTQRRLAVEIRLKLYQSDLAPDVLSDVLTAWWAADKPAAVRSSALIEDRAEYEFRRPVRKLSRRARRRRIPHQLARLLGGAVDHQRAAIHGAARARSRRHRDGGAGSAAGRRARVGRGFERNRRRPDADFSATWGLGSAIAQGEVVPDRIVLSRHGFVRSNEAGRKHHREACVHGAGTSPQAVPDALARAPCLEAGQATALGRLMRKARRGARHAGRDRMGARR